MARWLLDLWGPFGEFKAVGAGFSVLICLMAIPFRFPPRAPEQPGGKEALEDGGPRAARAVPRAPTAARTVEVGEELVLAGPHILAALMPVFALCNGAERPLFGWLADRWSPAAAAVTASSLIVAASSLAPFIRPGAIVIYTVTFALLWLTLGGWMAVAPAATAAYFGRRNHSRNYGLVFTAYGFGAILGGAASGLLRDVLGTYQYALYPIGAAGVVSIMLALTVRSRPAQQPRS